LAYPLVQAEDSGEPPKIDHYGQILKQWMCNEKSCAGQPCYHEKDEDGTEGAHIALSNQVMSEWADKCVSSSLPTGKYIHILHELENQACHYT